MHQAFRREEHGKTSVGTFEIGVLWLLIAALIVLTYCDCVERARALSLVRVPTMLNTNGRQKK